MKRILAPVLTAGLLMSAGSMPTLAQAQAATPVKPAEVAPAEAGKQATPAKTAPTPKHKPAKGKKSKKASGKKKK